jgi:biotin carboxylase
MKKAFCRGGVSSSEFAKISTETEAIQAAAEIGYPVMLKIVDKSGSRGITKTYNDDQLLEAYRYAKSCSELPYFLIEKYISGREIGVDAFIQNGKVKLIIPHEKLVYHSMRTGIPIGHICPMVTSSALKDKIEKEMRASIGALGLDNCAVNMDAFITDDGDVSVIEVAGRCGATGIPEVISGYLGVNYYEIILKLALGEEIELPEKFNTRPTLSFLLFAEKNGIIDCIEYEADEQKLQLTDYENPGKIKVHLDYIPGEVVEQFTNGTKRIGLVVLSDENRDALLQKYEQFEKSFHIRLK